MTKKVFVLQKKRISKMIFRDLTCENWVIQESANRIVESVYWIEFIYKQSVWTKWFPEMNPTS